MNWRINLVFSIIIFVGCGQEKSSGTEEIATIKEAVESNYLIEVNEFITLANQPNIKIIDFRKKERYEKEHIKGALHIWRTDIEDASFLYGGMMANQTQIETLFSNLGIHIDDTLIIYDDNGLCDSARLWWLLQNYDFTNVKLFHGGINSWKENNGAVSTEAPLIKKTVFKLPETSSMKYYVSKEEIIHALNAGTVVLDTRSLDEFSGKRQKKGAMKGGRIPTSFHIDWAEAIDYNGGKRFKSIQELTSIYGQINRKKDEPIIVYCHSGVRSAHTTFVLTQLLDYKNVKNYDGSWLEWSYFKELDFEKDSLTTINN